MYDLVLYDTSNFVDFPIGGQLTSIRNFLKYVANYQTAFADCVLLVGITTQAEEVGRILSIEIDDVKFDFLPVLCRNSNLSNVQKSLRVEYLKALIRSSGRIVSHKGTIHYIHTPEAYIAVKLAHLSAKTAVFSHGSFFNMVEGFRFFQKNKLVHMLFNQFIILLLRSADLLFVLDEDSVKQYSKYTDKVCRVENSIVITQDIPLREVCHAPVRLLFVGRLSKVKRVEGIIEAAELANGQVHLTIVGDGEERSFLESLVKEKQLEPYVTFLGSMAPTEVGKCIHNSDILVMNSVLEGKPMTILEAMSHGLPVIATPVGGIPEMVSEGMDAEFTDGSSEAIIRKVGIVQENYQVYSYNSRIKALKYDFGAVNESVFERLMRVSGTKE